jgi:putative aldouronate transport system substrate-binding protein
VGKEVKNHYTIPEILEIAALIKEQDPGNVGAALAPISMTAANAASFFLRANSTYWDSFYKDADGKYVWGAAAAETLEGLKYWYEAYSTGLLDPEFYLLAYEKDMEKFQTLGTAGISYLGGQTADVERFRQDFTARTGIDGSAFGLATLLGADGNYHQRDLINFWGTICFKPDVSDAVFERWMDLMEFTASKDGYPGTQMGLKGVDWDYDANGEIISLVAPGTLLAGAVGEAKYPSLGHVLGSSILWDDLAFDNPNIGKSYRDESKALYANRYEFSTPETFAKVDWNLWLHNTENMRRAKGIDYTTEFANMVTTATSADNLVELYNNWLTSQMGLIQPVLDELNQ